MLTPIPTVENFSFPSVLVASAQGIPVVEGPNRRQEFESILPQVMLRFRNMAMRWLRNPEDAEDAVQDAMLSAFRHIDSFDGRSQMMTWLTTILINAVRMQIRRRPRGHMLPLDHDQEEGKLMLSEVLADLGPTPEQTFEQSELSKLVGKLTTGLSLAQQAALRLRMQDDLSIQETAEKLGVPEGTVKAQIARSRVKLTERFRAATTKPKIRSLVVSPKLTRERVLEHRSAPSRDHMPPTVFTTQGSSRVCASV